MTLLLRATGAHARRPRRQTAAVSRARPRSSPRARSDPPNARSHLRRAAALPQRARRTLHPSGGAEDCTSGNSSASTHAGNSQDLHQSSWTLLPLADCGTHAVGIVGQIQGRSTPTPAHPRIVPCDATVRDTKDPPGRPETSHRAVAASRRSRQSRQDRPRRSPTALCPQPTLGPSPPRMPPLPRLRSRLF